MSEHTPGPWYVADGCSWRRILQEGTDAMVLVPTNAPDGWPDLTAENGRRDDNLRLAAAAPDLLEACEHAVVQMQRPWEMTSSDIATVREQLQAVVAKARGET